VAVVLGPDVGVAPGGKTEQNCVKYEGNSYSLGCKLAELFGSIDGRTDTWPNAREVIEEIWDRKFRLPEGVKEKTTTKPLSYIYRGNTPCLISLNDSWGWSFPEIAELLERCYPAIEDPTNPPQTPTSA